VAVESNPRPRLFFVMVLPQLAISTNCKIVNMRDIVTTQILNLKLEGRCGRISNSNFPSIVR